MRIGTANIQNFNPDLTPRQVRKDARTIAGKVTIAGLQEIQPDEDETPVRIGLEAGNGHGWSDVGLGEFECPIVFREDLWALAGITHVPFHRPKLPRPETRHAGVVSAAFRSRSRPNLPAFAVVNTHLVAGGMNEPHNAEIADQWRHEWKVYTDVIRWHHERRRTVFALGDLNTPKPPDQLIRWYTPQGHPDHIGVLEHEDSVRLVDATTDAFPLESDHPLRRLSGRLERVPTRRATGS